MPFQNCQPEKAGYLKIASRKRSDLFKFASRKRIRLFWADEKSFKFLAEFVMGLIRGHLSPQSFLCETMDL